MPSINEINIAVNSLFLDITNPLTLNLNKAEVLSKYSDLNFIFNEFGDFEFNFNPIFRFDSAKELEAFIEREKSVAAKFQEQQNFDYEELNSAEEADPNSLDNFYLNYSVEINNEDVTVLFNTNSLIFKYEMIG